MPIIKGFATLLIWWHKDECIQRETQRQNLQNSTDYSLMCLICNLHVSNECSHTLAALGRENSTVQFSARSYFAGGQNYAKYFKSNSRNKYCILGRVWDTLIKHRHARPARVFFCDLKALEVAVLDRLLTVMIRVTHSRILVPDSIQWHYRLASFCLIPWKQEAISCQL